LFQREKANKAILQVFFYAWLVKLQHGDNTSVIPVLYPVRDMETEDFEPEIVYKQNKAKQVISSELYDELLPEFIHHLSDTLNEIFDKTVPFDQTSDSEKCRYCDYHSICGIIK